jgi:phosphoribosylaminoimidazole-succinocarboxamide synthase
MTSVRKIASGKVREIYDLDDEHLLLVSSDRISAFDVIMDEPVPDRGRVLTALTDFWLREVASDVPNHLVSTDVPDVANDLVDAEGRSMVVRKAEMLPVEFIVRSYLAGSGWKEYRRTGTLHGQALPEGLQLGSKLPEPVLTPSTKGELGEHDINLTWDEAAAIIGVDVMREAETMALDMFGRGSRLAAEHGFLLADTKFELGYIDGTLALCDEVLTPDSSRYWPTTGWELGEDPPSYDKQILRYYLETLDWGKVAPPPVVPPDVLDAVRSRYIEIYERLSGRSFAEWPGVGH